MLLYDRDDKKMSCLIKEFKTNGGDFLVQAVCEQENYAINFFRSDKSFKRKWEVDISPKDKAIHLNLVNKKDEINILGLAKAFAFEKAYKENQTDYHDPKFKNRVTQSYQDNMVAFLSKSHLINVTAEDFNQRPMVNGLKGHKANFPNWKRSLKKIKKFSALAVE